jgi:hypothetical protein
MTDETKQEVVKRSFRESLLERKAPITIAGVLLFGIVGSALYDFFVKPGINIFAETLFNILTFGSQQIKDYSFNTAALDPTSTPALILLIAAATLATWYPFDKLFRRRLRMSIDIYASKPIKIFVLRWVLLPLTIAFQMAMIFLPLNIFNQAILTWRVFNANIAIVTPVVDEKEIKGLKARFASMRSQADYQVIHSELVRIADEKKIHLRTEQPW